MAGILLAVLIVEVVGPAFMPPELRPYGVLRRRRPPHPSLVGDRDVRVKYLPGLHGTYALTEGEWSVRTISLGFDDRIGFRDDGIDGQPFAVALGDSFTFCYGVDDDQCWVELLEQRTGLDFANLAVPGTGPLDYTRMLRKYGVQLQPRLILYGIFTNDYWDNLLTEKWLQEGRPDRLDTEEPQADEAENGSLLLRVRAFLSRNSVIYRLLAFTYRSIRGDEVWSAHQGEVTSFNLGSSLVVYRDGRLDYIFKKQDWPAPRDLSTPEMQRAAEYSYQAIAEAQAIAESIHADLVVLLFPFKEQVHWFILKQYLEPSEQADVNWPLELIARYCQANGIRCLDLTPGLVARAKAGEQLYYRYDMHLNPTGNQAVADRVYEYLESEGLLIPRSVEAP